MIPPEDLILEDTVKLTKYVQTDFELKLSRVLSWEKFGYKQEYVNKCDICLIFLYPKIFIIIKINMNLLLYL